MRRFVDRWWLVGSVLTVAVAVVTAVFYVAESERHLQEQRATQRQAVTVLRDSVDDVLAREVALARVVGTLPGQVRGRWAVLSSIVMSQPLANSTGFIEPVLERRRRLFEQQTGLRLVESPAPGVVHVAARRSLHLVLSAYREVGPGAPPLGLDLSANALRRGLLVQTAATGAQLATPPVDFLGRRTQARGVLVYAVVHDARGRMRGWVSASYEARQLAAMVTARVPGLRLTIRDGASTLVSEHTTSGDPAGHIAVAGRRWRVWAQVPGSAVSAIPWLVLSLGLVLTGLVTLILRQSATRARDSAGELAVRDAEEAAFGQIATLVAQGATPDQVFTAVAEQIAGLFGSRVGSVSRFDAAQNQGVVVGAWTRDGETLTGTVFALDGVTASAEVFRTGRPAYTRLVKGSADPIPGPMAELVARGGVATPIVVAGELWGALGMAHDARLIPPGVELRLQRFASLVALAISNSEAWARLAQQASSDPLTGIANRRAFDERLGAEVARAKRYERKLSLVLFDLDHFKAVNDRHGHQAGDRVLVLFAQLLSAHGRDGELIARVGGEEFAWLMPETDQQGAYTAANRVREVMERTTFEGIDTITLSAGVCSSEDARDAATLFGNADRALYWAKDSGRNMTFLYSEQARMTLGDDDATDREPAPPTDAAPGNPEQAGHGVD